jgi:acylphosphatase
VVQGRVQGVGFRWFVLRHAQDLGLIGWVANRPDGSVEVVARGPDDAMDRLDILLRSGPRLARVDRVEKTSNPHDTAQSKTFEIK